MSHKKDARLIWVKYFNQNPACYHACVIIEHRQRLCSQLTPCTILKNIRESIFKVVLDVAPSPWSLMPLGLKGIFGPSIKFSNNFCLDYEYARTTCIIINFMSMYTCVFK